MAFRAILFFFIAIPIIEIFLLIQVGGVIGAWWTIGIVIITAIIGTRMLRSQGLSTLAKAQNRMSGGEIPAFEMMEGMALGVGGALLLTPGFVTDAIGFFCLIPFTRKFMVNAMSKRVSVASVAGGFASGVPGQGSPTSSKSKSKSIDGEIIEGEFTRKD